jgi:hypothetical protein
MTTAADDTSAEDAFEAVLAGRPVSEGAAGLAAFAEAVRATATVPGRPNAALAELLATGRLTDQSSPSARTAQSAGRSPQPRRSRVRRRRRFAMIFPALLAKFLSAGAVAQAASGAGVALVAFTGAGAAGVLPDPIQETFSSVVSSETIQQTAPAEDMTPATATPESTPAEDPAAETPEVGDNGELTRDKWEDGPLPGQSFGDWVSEGARHGFTDGDTISDWAHEFHENRRDGNWHDGSWNDDHQGDEDRRNGTTAPAAPTPGAGYQPSEAPEVEDSGHGSHSGQHDGVEGGWGHGSGDARGSGGGGDR